MQDPSATPFFSIIIPCCNAADCICNCLETIRTQPFGDWECLVCVETSTDSTEQTVRDYVSRDGRFRVFTGPRSGSPSTPRNKGLDNARGRYVIFVDADDAIVEGSLDRLHSLIEARPDADLYPCAINVRDESTSRAFVHDNYPPDAPAAMSGRDAIKFFSARRRRPFPMAQMTICRREFLEAQKLRFVPGLQQEDSEFLPRSLYRAGRVVPLHEPFYIYVKGRSDTISSIADRNRRVLAENFARAYNSLLRFFATVSKENDFDRDTGKCWAKDWLADILLRWFDTRQTGGMSRETRRESLAPLFAGAEDGFAALLAHASPRHRTIARLVRAAARNAVLFALADILLSKAYLPLAARRK